MGMKRNITESKRPAVGDDIAKVVPQSTTPAVNIKVFQGQLKEKERGKLRPHLAIGDFPRLQSI